MSLDADGAGDASDLTAIAGIDGLAVSLIVTTSSEDASFDTAPGDLAPGQQVSATFADAGKLGISFAVRSSRGSSFSAITRTHSEAQ